MSNSATQNRYLELIGIGLIALIIVVVLPLTVDIFRLNLVGKYLTYAFVAVGLVLCWGRTGILSLGQGCSSASAAIAWRCSSSSRHRAWPTPRSNRRPAFPTSWTGTRSRIAVLLGAVQIAALRPDRGHRGTDDRGVHRRPGDVQTAGRRRLLRHHHAGARRRDDHPDRRPAGLHRRHQRHHRSAHAARLGHPHRRRQIHPLFRLLRASPRHHVRGALRARLASSAASWSPPATRRTASGSPATTSPTTRSSCFVSLRRWRRSAARCSPCRSDSCRRPSSASCPRSRW